MLIIAYHSYIKTYIIHPLSTKCGLNSWGLHDLALSYLPSLIPTFLFHVLFIPAELFTFPIQPQRFLFLSLCCWLFCLCYFLQLDPCFQIATSQDPAPNAISASKSSLPTPTSGIFYLRAIRSFTLSSEKYYFILQFLPGSYRCWFYSGE